MNRLLTIIGILILLLLGSIQWQLYRQNAVLNAVWSRLDDLDSKVEDLASQPDGDPNDGADNENMQCVPDTPGKQI